MKITIDLSGSDLQDDMAYIRDAYTALEELTSEDSHRSTNQLQHVSNLLFLLNTLQGALTEQARQPVPVLRQVG